MDLGMILYLVLRVFTFSSDKGIYSAFQNITMLFTSFGKDYHMLGINEYNIVEQAISVSLRLLL